MDPVSRPRNARSDRRNTITLGVAVAGALFAVLLLSTFWGDAPGSPPVAPATAAAAEAAGSRDGAPAGPLPRTSVASDASGAVEVRGRLLGADGAPFGRALVGDAHSARPGATNEDGRFAIFAERDGTTITLLALATGHAPLLSRHEASPAARTLDVGDLRALAGGGIRGRVQDRIGNGVAGALALLRPTSGNALPEAVDLAKLLPAATTAADGTYAFGHLAPGRYRVRVSAPGYQDLQSPALTVTDGSVTEAGGLVLEVGYALAGTVLGPDAAPVPDARVRLRDRQGGSRYDRTRETANDGRFEFGALPPGPLEVEVTRSGFLRSIRADVDPTRGTELIVHLEAGLRVAGTVVDARSGGPIVRFAASIRRIGEVDPPQDGSMAQQLRRRIESLRSGSPDPEARERRHKIAAELEARVRRVDDLRGTRPVAAPADVGPVTAHDEGRFSFDGLDEGLYRITVASPEHASACVESIELRRGLPPPAVLVELGPGHSLSGVVVSKHDGSPVADADVELVRVFEAPREERERQHSLYPWVFARSGPQGVTVMATRTDRAGRFEFHDAAPGPCLLSIRQAAIADHDTDPFPLEVAAPNLRIAVGARARLTGRVLDIPAGGPRAVDVIVLGGHGTMRIEKAGKDGTYVFERLQPGSYLVRAFPAGSRTHVDRLFGSIFPLHAGGVDQEAVPERDVVLAEGETRTFDVSIALPPTGSVHGILSVNGQPGKGCRAILRPVPGQAPGAGNLSLRGDCDDMGRFAVDDVPQGTYTLALLGATRQELSRESLNVQAGARVAVHVDLAAGGLRGRVTAADGTRAEDLRGQLWVLPGASAAPADPYAFRRTNRTHRLRVRDASFADGALTPGPALVVVDIEGRERVVTRTAIPRGGLCELELTVGAVK